VPTVTLAESDDVAAASEAALARLPAVARR
jgi:hypothetical protein